jgi:deoxycytidylate deaminase
MAYKSISRFRLGAVLVKKNRVISTGYNDMSKTHTLMQKFNLDKSWAPGLHAEVHACIGVHSIDLDYADLYVVRVLRNGETAMAKPCKICHKFLMSVGLRRVYYSVDDNGWAELETT